MPDSLVIDALRKYRLAMDALDAELMDELARRWLAMERRLQNEVDALAAIMAQRAAAGETITQQMIWKAERYQILRAQMDAELLRYNREAAILIADYQKQAAQLGIDAAQDALLLSYPSPLSVAFTQINIDAVNAMIGFAKDGSPLYSLLAKSFEEVVVKAILDGMIADLAMGKSAIEIARGIMDAAGMGLDRAMLIARTETQRAYRMGSTEQYRQSGVTAGFMRLVKKDGACLACLMLDGERFNLEDELDDHPNGRAELPDNLILTDAPTALETFWHDGEIIIIRTASGKELSVTPNHPILTRRGWVAASFIQEGDNVVGYCGRDWASSLASPHKNHIPARAKNIAGAFNMFNLGRVPKSAQHLYRNGEGGEVNVIFINRFLWDGFNATLQKKIREYFFGNGYIGFSSLNSFSAIKKMFNGLKFTANRILGIFNNGIFFILTHINIPQFVSGRHSAGGNVMSKQNFSNNLTGDIELFRDCVLGFSAIEQGANSDFISNRKDDFIRTINGQFLGLNRRSFGFVPDKPLSLENIRQGLLRSMPTGGGALDTVPGQVGFDCVINILRRCFRGHVYSLQTKTEWYISNGIISHNCTAVPVVEGVEPPSWEFGKDWFENLSEEKQREIMGDTRYDKWQNGTPLDSFIGKHQNDTWGPSPSIIPIRDLKG